jgi:prepilin-type N-terminal cleavage/methylation domain-containing protein
MGDIRNKRQMSGFTLIEIMLVVGIIGLLCAIIIPEFMKARKRSQATMAIQELKKVQDGIDRWAVEFNKKSSDPVAWPDIREYVKENTPLYNRQGNDYLGHPFLFTTVGSGVKVDEITRVYFSGVNVDFTEFQQ